MRVLVVGDTHGNINFLGDIFAAAVGQDIDAIFQVGDFGYWEQIPEGVAFLDAIALFCAETGIPFYWLDGNHENHTLLRERYQERNDEGFIVIRDGVFYAPRGHRWEWEGVRFMAVGGAYSVDKGYRLKETASRVTWARERAAARRKDLTVEELKRFDTWWPEEELTDAEVDVIMRDTSPVDVMLTHDKPRRSAPRWNRKDILECFPNQDKLQRIIDAVQPRLLIHGHLHFAYRDVIRVGDDDANCEVRGLACDSDDWADNHLIIDLAHVREAVHGQ